MWSFLTKKKKEESGQRNEWRKGAEVIIKAEENYCVHFDDEDYSELAEVRLELWKWVWKFNKCL